MKSRLCNYFHHENTPEVWSIFMKMYLSFYLWKNRQCSMFSCSRMQRWSSPTLLHWHSSCNSGRTDGFWWWTRNNSDAGKAELLVEVVVGLFFAGTLLPSVVSYRMWFWRLMQFLLFSPQIIILNVCCTALIANICLYCGATSLLFLFSTVNHAQSICLWRLSVEGLLSCRDTSWQSRETDVLICAQFYDDYYFFK